VKDSNGKENLMGYIVIKQNAKNKIYQKSRAKVRHKKSLASSLQGFSQSSSLFPLGD